MNMKEFTLKASDGFELSCALFENENPKALIQVIHGAKEHKGRYYHFCGFLQEMGYAVITSDNRGHGKSVNEKYFLGHFESAERIVEDQHEISLYIKQMYPGRELYLFGHSFGSIIARMYLQNYDDEIEKLVMTGTVLPMHTAGIARGITALAKRTHGTNTLKGLIARMVNSGPDSWVCGNPYTMREYHNDPLVQNCNYTNGAINAIAAAEANLTKYKKFSCKNKELRILTANGEKDVFRGTYKGLHRTVKALNKVGYIHVQTITYPGMKHEIINELDKASVYSDIVRYYNS